MIAWQCVEYVKTKCSGRCNTICDEIIKITPHNHVPNSTKTETKKVLSLMKVRARNSQEVTH